MQIPSTAVLASWPPSNYSNPSETRGSGLLISTAVFLPLALIVVILRIYTRIQITHSFGADDVFIIFAAALTVTCAIATLIAVQQLGWGRHVWDIPEEYFTPGLKLMMVMEITFAAGAAMTKLSLLFFYRRLMNPGRSVLRIINWIFVAATSAEAVMSTVMVLNTC
jgi:hypothetical protein